MSGAILKNGQAVPLRDVPMLSEGAFRTEVVGSVEKGHRLVSFFGEKLAGGRVRLLAILADDAAHTLSVRAAVASDRYPALTSECPQAHLFEREVFEQTGVVPEGHPWLKPVRRHDLATTPTATETARHPFFAMSGDEVHEVAVGPVHAGVIEPGHFRFQCHGEVVHHLEIHLGYQHRGVEEALVGGPHKRTMFQMETVAGDTTIGHGIAYCMAQEALSGTAIPPRAHALRAIALELERLANHVGDMGALSNDVAFLPTSSYCGRLRGDFLNVSAELCGSRLGRGFVRHGGVAFDITQDQVKMLSDRLVKAQGDLMAALDEFFESPSVLSRLQGTGPITVAQCRDLGFVGVAARAAGLDRDVRADHPFGRYTSAPIAVSTWPSGDVMARAMVRRLEIEASLAYILQQMAALPLGPTLASPTPLAPDSLAVALTEGWRGEVVHVAATNAAGRFSRYKITDPSFHNWFALALALRGQQISDFPLCNKSFNLSYCGFDL